MPAPKHGLPPKPALVAKPTPARRSALAPKASPEPARAGTAMARTPARTPVRSRGENLIATPPRMLPLEQFFRPADGRNVKFAWR